MQVDFWLFQQINGLAGKFAWLDWLGIFLASYYQYLVVGALLLFIFISQDKKEQISRARMAGLAFLAALVARFGVVTTIYYFYIRLRPFVAHAATQLISYDAAKPSFPSGHATFFFALAMVVYLYNKKIGAWFLAAALLISLARVYAGVHYLSDILAGVLIGSLVGWGVWEIAKKAKLIN